MDTPVSLLPEKCLFLNHANPYSILRTNPGPHLIASLKLLTWTKRWAFRRLGKSGKSRRGNSQPAGTDMRMDALRELLRDLKQQGLGQGNFLGLLNVLIGRRVHRTDGTLVSAGCSWRTAAGYLK